MMTSYTHFKHKLIYGIVMILLLALPHSINAQEGTGAPPPADEPNSQNTPAGVVSVPNAPLVLPPEGVRGLDGCGVITIVPAGEEHVSYINVCDDVTTVYAPTLAEDEIIVRAELELSETLSDTFPISDEANILEGIELNVYWQNDGEEIFEHDPPIVLARDVPNPEITLVFAYDEQTGLYTPLVTESFTVDGSVSAEITQSHPNITFVWVEIADAAAYARYQAEAERNAAQRLAPLARSRTENLSPDEVQAVSETVATQPAAPLSGTALIPYALMLLAIACVMGGLALVRRTRQP